MVAGSLVASGTPAQLRQRSDRTDPYLGLETVGVAPGEGREGPSWRAAAP